MLKDTQLLQTRLEEHALWLNAAMAARLGIADNASAKLHLGDRDYEVVVHIEAELPEDCVLIPRSMGIPLFGPVAVTIQALQTETLK